MPGTSYNIKLSDGRNLNCHEYGEPKGKPVMYFHGGGVGSGLYVETLSNIAAKCGIRLLAPDRPGIGQSDIQESRNLSDWVYDTKELADSLMLNKFSIVSESAGSAYAFICASRIPERIDKIAIVSGLCPLDNKSLKKKLTVKNRITLGVLKNSPKWLLKKMFSSMKAGIEKDSDAFFKKTAARSNEKDKEIMTNREFQISYKSSILNTFKQGYAGVLQYIGICSSPWGIDFKSLSSEITIWHGENDESAPLLMTKRMVELLKDCKTFYLPGETHMSVLQNHAEEIFESCR